MTVIVLRFLQSAFGIFLRIEFKFVQLTAVATDTHPGRIDNREQRFRAVLMFFCAGFTQERIFVIPGAFHTNIVCILSAFLAW